MMGILCKSKYLHYMHNINIELHRVNIIKKNSELNDDDKKYRIAQK